MKGVHQIPIETLEKFNLKLQKLSPDEIKFFQTRPWTKPIHQEFQEWLNKHFPNTYIVPFPDDYSVIALYVMNEIFSPILGNKIILKPIIASNCHDNCEVLQKSNSNLVSYYGYALSEDSRWRNHSWLVDSEGNIIETTQKRWIYIGYKNK